MTEMENEYEIVRKYTRETGHEFKETENDYELIEWLLKEILGLKQELTSLRSRLAWHYASEVPENNGRYVGEFQEGVALADYFVEENAWNHMTFGCFYDIKAYEAPIRWAYLPTEKE
jgi:hypothetical protein